MSNVAIETSLPTPLQQAGVARRLFNSDTLQLNEIPGAAMLRLHSLIDPESMASAIDETGITVPLKTGQAEGEDPFCLCLRPREWLIFSENRGVAELEQQLQNAIDMKHAALHDTSDGLAVFRLSGAGAPWLLSKLSCLDFVAGSSAGQHCARTRMAQASVLVHYHDCAGPGLCFDLILDRSIAKYLWTLLIESAPHADELVKHCSE